MSKKLEMNIDWIQKQIENGNRVLLLKHHCGMISARLCNWKDEVLYCKEALTVHGAIDQLRAAYQINENK